MLGECRTTGKRTVGDGSIKGFLVVAVGCEGVGKSSEIRLEHTLADWVVEPLSGRIISKYLKRLC